jgi:hypothetical protein
VRYQVSIIGPERFEAYLVTAPGETDALVAVATQVLGWSLNRDAIMTHTEGDGSSALEAHYGDLVLSVGRAPEEPLKLEPLADMTDFEIAMILPERGDPS